MKFISFVAFEQLKTPNDCPPCFSRADFSPRAVRSKASSHVAGRSALPRVSRIMGWPSRTYFAFDMNKKPPGVEYSKASNSILQCHAAAASVCFRGLLQSGLFLEHVRNVG